MNVNLTLIGQIGTFLVFWLFVYKVIWPIFKKISDERQQKIADGLSLADKAKATMAEAQLQSDEAVAKAKAQASDIVSRAHKQASEMVEKARDDAKKAGNIEIKQARDQIDQEKRQTRDELKSRVSALVIQGVEKIVEREINTSDHEELIDNLTEKL